MIKVNNWSDNFVGYFYNLNEIKKLPFSIVISKYIYLL